MIVQKTRMETKDNNGIVQSIRSFFRYLAISAIIGYVLLELQRAQDVIIGLTAITLMTHAYLVILNLFALLFILSIYSTAVAYKRLLETKLTAIEKAKCLETKTEFNVHRIQEMVDTLRRG